MGRRKMKAVKKDSNFSLKLSKKISGFLAKSKKYNYIRLKSIHKPVDTERFEKAEITVTSATCELPIIMDRIESVISEYLNTKPNHTVLIARNVHVQKAIEHGEVKWFYSITGWWVGRVQ